MSDKAIFRLVHDHARRSAVAAVNLAPMGHVVEIKPAKRSDDQNRKLHAIVSDIAKARPEYAGVKMDDEDWKALLILSHAVATKGEGSALRMVPDLEASGYVQLRESSARMSKARGSSLIEYCIAWATAQGIQLKEQA